MPSGAPPGEALRLKFVTDPLYGGHLQGAAHPERPQRVEVVASRLRALGVMRQELPARDATDEELLRAHTPEYLALVKRECGAREDGRDSAERFVELSTGDVLVGPGTLAAARRASGGAIVAVEACVAGGEPVFALVRPPGHHAEPDRGMGFCIFNNAVVAARAFQTRCGGRVLIADFDYHHGNGTEAMAGNGLSYVSTHAYPAYPGTGMHHQKKGGDVVVNLPLPAGGVETASFTAIWNALLPAVAAAVRPDLLILSAGFDYVRGDGVGDLGVEVEAAASLGGLVARVAARHCGGRATYVLEGGYDLDALVGSIAGLAGAAAIDVPEAAMTAPVTGRARRALDEIARFLEIS